MTIFSVDGQHSQEGWPYKCNVPILQKSDSLWPLKHSSAYLHLAVHLLHTSVNFRPVPLAYRPQAGISNPEGSNPEGSIFRPFSIFDLFPWPAGYRLGSQIQKGQIRKGLFLDPSPVLKIPGWEL
jgi:hypothetical protein